MKRMHVHIRVADLAHNIRFYSALFNAGPAVVKSDYAKWMLEDPRLNFAISTRTDEIGLDHLGFQVESEDELYEMESRLAKAELPIETEEGAACCYAKSNKQPQRAARQALANRSAVNQGVFKCLIRAITSFSSVPATRLGASWRRPC